MKALFSMLLLACFSAWFSVSLGSEAIAQSIVIPQGVCVLAGGHYNPSSGGSLSVTANMAPAGNCPIRRPRSDTSFNASSSDMTPARHAATYSPTL